MSLAPSNPYQPPSADDTQAMREEQVARSGWLLAIEWSAVFLFNLIVPALFGWSMTSTSAKLGSIAACLCILAIGYAGCARGPLLMLTIIRGSALIALTQVVPVLQIFCGMLAIQSLIFLGWIQEGNFHQMLQSAVSGFFVTWITGSLLIATGFLAGLLFRCITPKRWWVVSSPLPSNPPSP
jgi:hypothetical protein